MQMVLDGRFRLVDSFSGHDIDLSLPFRTVFRAGRQIAMDMLFDWDEATMGSCQRCSSSDVRSDKRGLVCSKCSFRFRRLLRAYIPPSPPPAHDQATRRRTYAPKPVPDANRRKVAFRPIINARAKKSAVHQTILPTQEKPSDFARICIGAEPDITLATLGGSVLSIAWDSAIELEAYYRRNPTRFYTFEDVLAHLLGRSAPITTRLALFTGLEYVSEQGVVLSRDNWINMLGPGFSIAQRKADRPEDKRKPAPVAPTHMSASTGARIDFRSVGRDYGTNPEKPIITSQTDATNLSPGVSKRPQKRPSLSRPGRPPSAPTFRGFWVCCLCRQTNNPAVAPLRCPVCAHFKCKGGCYEYR